MYCLGPERYESIRRRDGDGVASGIGGIFSNQRGDGKECQDRRSCVAVIIAT